MTLRTRLKKWLQRIPAPIQAASVTAQVDDSPGWTGLSSRPHEYDAGKVQEIYADALVAWRKNPIAWRIIQITTDYVVGDQLHISSPNRLLNQFVYAFWNHPQNRLGLRLESLCDELSRAGDLFLVLFLNRQDGMSYLRMVTKDRIVRIETADNDWECEIAYHERLEAGETRRWLSPFHPEAAQEDAVMLHYAVNRPVGNLLGESDLTTLIPWLQRYSRMLEDRVRLHSAAHSFLWVITVPSYQVAEKQELYRSAPESGNVIIKDESEQWEVLTPDLKGVDARWDLQAVRQLVDAGSGYPPHWRGEPGDANLATATAMQGPTERHLLRRQRYFVFMLQDVLFQAYQRAVQAGRRPPLASQDYQKLFTVVLPEISRWDNESLARAARELAEALQTGQNILRQAFEKPTAAAEHQPGALHTSPTYARLALKLIAHFAGEPQPDEIIERILHEAASQPSQPNPSAPAQD